MLMQACMRAGAWRAFAPFRTCYVRPSTSCLAQRPNFTQPSQSGKNPGAKPAQNRRDSKGAPNSSAGEEKQRLSKVLAAAGVASRRACEELIQSGVVKVNGQLVMEQVLVDPSKDHVEVKGKKVDISKAGQQMYYFVVNKPKGYICSNVELAGKEGKRAVDLLQPWLDEWTKQNKGKKGVLPPRMFPVGRLDVATTGLLLLTNDGTWANKVIHPSSGLTKEYLVLVDKAPSKAQVNQMMRGVEIDGVLVQPEEVSLLEESVRLRIVVSEGKKHEIRVLVSSVGLEVLALKRTRVGGYRLPRTLKLGQCSALTPAEVRRVTDVKEQAALAPKLPSQQVQAKQPTVRGMVIPTDLQDI